MHFLESFYRKTLKYRLINKFALNSSYNLPKLKKIILNFNVKTNNIKQLSLSLLAIEILTKQKSKITLAKKSKILLKIYKGSPTGCKVILKKKKLFNFFNWTIFEIIPSLKQFNSFFTKKNTFKCEFKDLFKFNEFKNHYYYFYNLSNLQILIITKSCSKKKLKFFFKSLGFL